MLLEKSERIEGEVSRIRGIAAESVAKRCEISSTEYSLRVRRSEMLRCAGWEHVRKNRAALKFISSRTYLPCAHVSTAAVRRAHVFSSAKSLVYIVHINTLEKLESVSSLSFSF